MDNKTLLTLEYDKIKERLVEFTESKLGYERVMALNPMSSLIAIKEQVKNTSEAKKIFNKSNMTPLQGIHDIRSLLEKIEKGGVLEPTELLKISDFLRGCRKMKKFMKNHEDIAPNLSSYRHSISEFKELEEEVGYSIEGNRVSSKASSKLSKIRGKISDLEDKIEEKLNKILSSSEYKNYIQDYYVCKKNDRYVIPIKASYKNKVKGNIIDTSSTGSTVFIEPSSVGKATSELSYLKMEEDIESYQVLATLTGEINQYLKEIRINVEAMGEYDFNFAKAKYSNYINGRDVLLNKEGYIKLINAKHPLLGDEAVPLNFEIGKDYRTLTITGPNTGGKTVALKTIGLLTLMVQSGLHIPVDNDSELSIFEKIFTDIGDQQSIEQSLSTFSGHMANIIYILNKTNYSTLVLLDEVGTGTDPSEGAGLAAAILDELYICGSITVATTHYGEIKTFSSQHKGFENGCMEFDNETLKPLYKLKIGDVGESNALWISKRLGMRPRVLKLAEKYIRSNQSSNEEFKYDIEEVDLKLPKIPRDYKNEESINNNEDKEILSIGDSVIFKNSGEKGIVYELTDENGDLILLIKDEFIKVRRKKVRLYIRKEELYPPGYDLNIIFKPYEERKLEHDLSRGAIKKKDFDERIEQIKN